jgi:hypothetical protein
MLVKTLFPVLLLFVFVPIHAQTVASNKEQMPANTPIEKSWWNLVHYKIAIVPDYDKKFIAGTNEVTFTALQDGRIMQIDLQEPMQITKVSWGNVSLPYTRQKDAYRIVFPKTIKKGETQHHHNPFFGKANGVFKAAF